MRRALSFAFCTFSLLACGSPPVAREAPSALPAAPVVVPDESFRGVPVDEISAVVVNGRTIRRARLDERTAEIARDASFQGTERAARKRAVEELVDEALVDETAARLHVSVSPDELARAERMKQRELGLTDDGWSAALAAQGQTEESLARQWREAILRAKVEQLVLGPMDISEADVRAAYADWVRHQTFDVDVEALYLDATDKDASSKLAASIVGRARSGEDFCKLVTTYGIDASTKPECGSRGRVSPSLLVPEVSRALEKMREGDVSDPISVSNRLVVFRLGRRFVPTFEESREDMRDRAHVAREARLYAVWIADQRAHARIAVQ